jgi:tetratricopeptide (TPR) repeat protein
MVQRVALKIIKPGMDSKAVIARFEQERQALAVMDHPNVAKVLDGGVTQTGRPYFVMEYVKGEAITTFCDRNRLTIAQRLELFVPVCEAVQHAHLKGIIHRDIKPSNIMVSMSGGDDPSRSVHVKVIDFGVAKAVSHTLTDKTIFTEHGQIIGTPEYMSPEQAEMGRTDIDTRTDVYSLGVVLYELLSGSLPFDSRSLRSAGYAEIQRIIREVDPPRPSTRLSTLDDEAGATIAKARQESRDVIARNLRRELEWIPLKAMRKDRRERYTTPTDLADDVRRYIKGEPLEAGPEGTWYRAKKLISRHRGRVAVVGLMVALLVGATTVSTLLYLNANRERRLSLRSQADMMFVDYIAHTGEVDGNEQLLDEAWKLRERSGHVEDLAAAYHLALRASHARGVEVGERMLTRAEEITEAAGPGGRILNDSLYIPAGSPLGRTYRGRGYDDVRAVIQNSRVLVHAANQSGSTGRVLIDYFANRLRAGQDAIDLFDSSRPLIERVVAQSGSGIGPVADSWATLGWIAGMQGGSDRYLEALDDRRRWFAQQLDYRGCLGEYDEAIRTLEEGRGSQAIAMSLEAARQERKEFVSRHDDQSLRGGRREHPVGDVVRAFEMELGARLLPEAAAAEVEGDPRWAGVATRGTTLLLLREHSAQDLGAMNDRAWAAVRHSAEGGVLVRDAALLAQRIVAAAPGNGDYRNTLGVALYRAGEYPAALDALRRSEALDLARGKGESPANWAFIALSLLRMGEGPKAETARSTFERLAGQSELTADAEVRAWVREVEGEFVRGK